MVVNRLKEVWKVLISLFQASFVPGRQTIDNVVLCQEVLHSLQHTSSKKGGIIVKLDLEKAYDRVEWSFIENILRDTSIPESYTRVIMNLITSGSRHFLWNEEVIEQHQAI